jgi:hypothetical protein
VGDPIWEQIPNPRVVYQPQFQALEYVDYEVPSTVTATYRAKVEAPNFDDDVLNSPWTAPLVTATMPAFDSWWLRDPLNPVGLSMRLHAAEATLKTPKPGTTDYPVGSDSAIMTHDGSKDDDLAMIVFLLNETVYNTFRALVDSGRTLLLQDVLGRQWYVQSGDGTEYDILRSAKDPSTPWPVRHAHKVSIQWVSVEKPRSLAETASA